MHRIGFFVCRGYDALDLGGPLSAFFKGRHGGGPRALWLHVISQSGGPVPGNTGLSVDTKPIGRRMFDTVIFVGGDIDPMQTPENIAAAKNWAPGCAGRKRVYGGVSACGNRLADGGVSVTTHWRYAAQLQSRFPRAKVEATVSISRRAASGRRRASRPASTWRSAIERIWARRLRALSPAFGGSVSSVRRSVPILGDVADGAGIGSHPHRAEFCAGTLGGSVACRAARRGRKFEFAAVRARISPETEKHRRRRSSACVSKRRGCACRGGSEPIEQIALAVGFTDPERMRRAFIKLHGHPPQAIRRESRSNGAR